MVFSVVIPFMEDRVNNVNLVLHSLAVQDFDMSSVEIILVQDGGKDVSTKIEKLNLNVNYHLRPKFIRKNGVAPRNFGASVAKNEFLVFLDSDVLLQKDGLKYFAEDLKFNANRIICGTYAWRKPMAITPEDIRDRFDAIESEQLPTLECDFSHNIMPDCRQQFENSPEQVFYMEDGIHNFLACFGGLLCVPKTVFNLTGGFPNWLSAGLCDDGAAGLAWMLAGAGISFDKRVSGQHMYHSRNRDYVVNQSRKEAEELNSRYGLPPYQPRGIMPEEILKEYLELQGPTIIPEEKPDVEVIVVKDKRAVKLEGHPLIYALEKGVLKPIPDPETFFALGFKPGDEEIITREQFLKYKMSMPYMTAKRDLERKLNELTPNVLNKGRVIRFVSNPTVYWEHKGNIRGIPNPETLHQLGFMMDDVEIISDDEMKGYKEMPPFASIA